MPKLSSVLIVIITMILNTGLFTYFTVAEEPMYPFYILLFFAYVGIFCMVSHIASSFTNDKLDLPTWMK